MEHLSVEYAPFFIHIIGTTYFIAINYSIVSFVLFGSGLSALIERTNVYRLTLYFAHIIAIY